MTLKNLNQKNDFSVLMCVYHNDDPFLFNKALKSVFSNTLLPQKLILVIDGPISPTLEEILRIYLKYPGIHVVRLPKNLGFVSALNEGLKFVETDWVIRADADDVNLDNRFEVLQSHMNADLDLLGSFLAEKNENEEIYCIKKVPLNTTEIFKVIKKRNPFNHPSVAFRKSKVIELGGYPNIELREDYGLWAMMLARGCKVKNIENVLVHASFGDKGFQRRKGGALIRAEVKLQTHLFKLGLTSFLGAILNGILRTILLSMPKSMIKILYLYFLRR